MTTIVTVKTGDRAALLATSFHSSSKTPDLHVENSGQTLEFVRPNSTRDVTLSDSMRFEAQELDEGVTNLNDVFGERAVSLGLADFDEAPDAAPNNADDWDMAAEEVTERAHDAATTKEVH